MSSSAFVDRVFANLPTPRAPESPSLRLEPPLSEGGHEMKLAPADARAALSRPDAVRELMLEILVNRGWW